jgi:Protein of unknown function (DUF4038)/Putative collagen-binding domain of a collagenase
MRETGKTTYTGPRTRRNFLGLASASLGTLVLPACHEQTDAPPVTTSSSLNVLPTPKRSDVFPLRRPQAPGRFLEASNATPFFLLGDSAWSLAVSASQADAIRYMDDRKAKGFNAFSLNAIEAEFAGGHGNRAPNNWYGESPFENLRDFTTAREGYWRNVDFIVQQAAARDLLCIIFPSYEGYGQGNQGWYAQMAAQGPVKLHRYGAWLAERYLFYDNILWVAGGDNNAANKELTKAIVDGIRSVSAKWLFSWHGARNSNALSFWDGDLGWLDLNTIYDSSDRAAANAEATYNNPTVKPFARIEDTYENPIVGGVSPAFIRWLAWSSALQGGTGAIYGDVAVWRFNGPGVVPDRTSWIAALDRPAGSSMRYLKQLYESLSWTKLVPHELTAGSASEAGAMRNLAAVANDGSFAIVYLVDASKSITVDLSMLSPGDVLVRWHDPASGTFTADGTYSSRDTRSFIREAANAGGNRDWILLFEVR